MGKRLDFSACPFPPTKHQIAGIEKIVNDPYVFLTDEMGMGKSKQIIDAASILFQHGVINKVLIVTTAATKSVWSDHELGQIVTHGWRTILNLVSVYHRRTRSFCFGQTQDDLLDWHVTNYEYIRRGLKGRSRYIPQRLQDLREWCDPQTLLVLDESSAVKSSRALQTRACKWLRNTCGRVVLLTGTPIAHSPLDLLSQANMLHPSILSDRPGEPMNLLQFRAKYCVMGGYQGKQILEFRNLEDLQERLRPFTLRRLKKDCLDLPPKLAPVTLTATLTPQSWKLYKEMRDHAIVELSGEVSVAQQAVTKLTRLSQLTSGFLGGFGFEKIQETGSEKITVLVDWLSQRLEEDPAFKVVIWTQFRADVERVAEKLTSLPMTVGRLWGENSSQEREEVLRLLHPSTTPQDAVAVVGTPQTGAFGITLAAASTMVYLNNAYSLNIRLQSEDRIHRPGQTGSAVNYFEIAAEGPKGQRTIDHIVLKALRQKRELADWTASAWLDELQQQKASDPSS